MSMAYCRKSPLCRLAPEHDGDCNGPGMGTRNCPVCGKARAMTGQHECSASDIKERAKTLVDALGVQVAGDHYVKYAVQPVEFIRRNGIPYIEGCIIKYVVRHRDKNGVEDLRKARHFLDMLIEEYSSEG